jgi:hypothetical protein
MVLRKLSTIAAVLVAVLGSLTVAAPANAANAFEFNHAVATTGDFCVIQDSPAGCGGFFYDGDVFFVMDSLPDGHSAAIYWHNYLASAPTTLYRWGSCVNSLGYNHYAQCNKNFREGSRVEWKICAYDSGTTPSDVNNYFECSAVWSSIA